MEIKAKEENNIFWRVFAPSLLISNLFAICVWIALGNHEGIFAKLFLVWGASTVVFILSLFASSNIYKYGIMQLPRNVLKGIFQLGIHFVQEIQEGLSYEVNCLSRECGGNQFVFLLRLSKYVLGQFLNFLVICVFGSILGFGLFGVIGMFLTILPTFFYAWLFR